MKTPTNEIEEIQDSKTSWGMYIILAIFIVIITLTILALLGPAIGNIFSNSVNQVSMITSVPLF